MNILNFEKGLENRRLEFVKSLLKEEGVWMGYNSNNKWRKIVIIVCNVFSKRKRKIRKSNRNFRGNNLVF